MIEASMGAAAPVRYAAAPSMAENRPTTARDHRQRILRVLIHLQQNLDEPLDVERLARVAALSPFHFHRVFRGLVGESVMEHVRRLRLERAAARLRFSQASVTEIALQAGYGAHEAFTRAFRSLFSLSPSSFRKQRRPLPPPPSPSGVHYSEEARVSGIRSARRPGARRLAEVRTRAHTLFAFVRHIGPYDRVGAAWTKLLAWAAPRGLIAAPAWGLSYDDPEITSPERVRYDACLEVDATTKPEGEIGLQKMPPGTFAVAVHRGPYTALGDTYARLMGVWAPASGRRLGPSPSLERYLDLPGPTRPQDLRTEIWLRLADGAGD
jgi:AraC family transcriptional regulator